MISSSLASYNEHVGRRIEALKPLQLHVIKSVLQKHTIAMLPTGYGKSLTYELLPHLMQNIYKKPVFVVVVVPLNVILGQQLKKLGSHALSLTADIKLDKDSSEKNDLLKGQYSFMFSHPEQLDRKAVSDILLHDFFQETCKTCVVVDEAHCVLEWGPEFRPSFKNLYKLRAIFPDATWLALSATISQKGQEDLAKSLSLTDYQGVSTHPAKDNISLVICKRPPASTSQQSVEYVLHPLLMDLIHMGQDVPLTIVYFSGSQNWLGYSYELAQRLLGDTFYTDMKTQEFARVVMFHASLEKGTDKLKSIIFTNLARDPLESPLKLVFATIALGMGADLTHVRRVVNIGPPKTMEAYVQQIGRAGRTGDQADAVLYYNNSDVGRPEVVDSMKILCRSTGECRRKLVNQSFGFHEAQSVPAELCCDICNQSLKAPYEHSSISGIARDTIRSALMTYIRQDETHYLQQKLSPSVLEQIICLSDTFSEPDALVHEFEIDVKVAQSIVSLLKAVTSCEFVQS